jgi:hypothetical protein
LVKPVVLRPPCSVPQNHRAQRCSCSAAAASQDHFAVLVSTVRLGVQFKRPKAASPLQELEVLGAERPKLLVSCIIGHWHVCLKISHHLPHFYHLRLGEIKSLCYDLRPCTLSHYLLCKYRPQSGQLYSCCIRQNILASCNNIWLRSF